VEQMIKRLAQATGLTETLAQTVLETAVEYIKTKRPDKAAQVDAMLQDDAKTQRAVALIAKLAQKVDTES